MGGSARIGGTVVAGAAVLASQGYLNIAAVLAASVLGAEAGGLAGYFVGVRWGRAIMNHPGPWLVRRQQAVTAVRLFMPDGDAWPSSSPPAWFLASPR